MGKPIKAFAANLEFDYVLVAAAQTAEVLGAAGASGDVLHRVVVTANTGTITILDGAVEILVIPAATVVGTIFEFNMRAVTNWNITTPATTECLCIGHFT
jgi:hypothetical protein